MSARPVLEENETNSKANGDKRKKAGVSTPAFIKQGRMASSQETQQDSGRDGRTYHAGHIGSHGVHQQVV